MKKILIGLVVTVMMLGAVSLDGKIGMGLGFAPDGDIDGFSIPIIDIAVTRYGLSPTRAIEPIFQFTMKSMGDGADVTSTGVKLSGLLNFLLRGHKKTNIYGKIGLGFGFSSSGITGAETEITFELPFGFGIEHFCSEHFSINLAAISGFRYISNPQYMEGSDLTLKLGNDKPFAFYLLWYY